MSSDVYGITVVLWLHHVQDVSKLSGSKEFCGRFPHPLLSWRSTQAIRTGNKVPVPRDASDNDPFIPGYAFRRLPRR